MTLNITIPENINDTKPKISVIGIGGAGGNAINTMINENIDNIEFIAANTDGQALSRSLTPRQIQLGKNITLGLGAGSDAETGRKAAEESIEEIISELGDVNMLFLTTGMGGGTGSGAAPVIAKAARDKGILTVAVVTKPFDFEGKKRMEVAENGLTLLKDHVDTLIVIPNQNLFKIANEKTTFAEAFKMADDVLYQGVCGITNLITNPGMINLDFADIKTVMGNMGKAMMGTGESSGEQRAINAAQEALNNPLLDDSNIKGAKSILLNIQGGPDMALFEVDEAASKIRNEVDENANIIFGSSIDNSLEGVIKVSVVATGIDNLRKDKEIHSIKLDVEPTKILEASTDKTDDIKVDLENINAQEYLNVPEEHNHSQIDIENEINQLDENHNFPGDKIDLNNESNKDNLSIINESNEEFDKVLSQKPNNQFTEAKPKTLFNRFSSFFINEETNEIKLEPSLSSENSTSVEKKILDTEINFENQNSTEILSNTDNLDLFDNKNQTILEDHQINLTEIEQETKEIDEKVLEIPAFLRRQAN